MATYDQLFGGSSSEKRPAPVKFPNVGDFHDMVVTEEPREEDQKEIGGSWEPLFLEKQESGKWKKKVKSDLVEGRDNFALTQTIIMAKLMDGTDTMFYLDNKVKREAFADAMKTSGLDLTVGTGVRITRTEDVGKSYGYKVQLAAPKE